MINEIQKKKLPILMKSGLSHWVTAETHGRVQEALQHQQAHSFIKITELGITLNTSEIEGVYTTEQYEDIVRLKQGQWQCSFKKWHPKRGECECRKELIAQRIRDKEAREQAMADRPRTPEEQAAVERVLAETRRDLENMGVLPKKR